MRAIDADALKKELAPYEENDFSQQIDVILKIVDAQPTLTPPNEWVSVEERLPETDGQNTHDYDVLVYIPKRDGCHQHGIYIGKLKKVPADDGSWNFWGIKTESSEWTVWGWGYFENPVVTHWMPLPERPKEDE